ncbi:MAG: winged helix-turn-helix domain-containing protein [Beijerinckiaceae bacterium]|jgi:DNA-binding winged helix-turn-helix (wHTH) protein
MNSRLVPMQVSRPDDYVDVPRNPPTRYVRFGLYELDLHRQELFREGLRVSLPHKVLEVLLILLEKPGDVVTREALRARLWPPDSQVNYNANVNTTVNKLRQALGDSTDQPAFVETIPRRGYSFIARMQYSNQPLAKAEHAEHTQPQPSPSSESAAEPIAASRRTFLRDARQSASFAIGVAGLLIAGILIGAIAAYLAFRH